MLKVHERAVHVSISIHEAYYSMVYLEFAVFSFAQVNIPTEQIVQYHNKLDSMIYIEYIAPNESISNT